MAQIQWYPGHMHKAQREIREALSHVDMFIELLDARLPYSSSNPMLAEIRGNKPGIKLMTKSDLAESQKTKLWIDWFQSTTTDEVLSAASSDRQKIRGLVAKCRAVFPERENVTVMVVGIPNVGKSTVINILADRVVAKTGNEPAVTKMQQKIKLDHEVMLLDTPGVLWPNVENPESGYRLAASGAIRQTAISFEDVAWHFSEFLLSQYPQLAEERYAYQTEEGSDPEPFINHVGKARGCLKSGGKVDTERVARIIIGDFRDGTLGRISLETPAMMQQENIEVERVREEKAEKKAARKTRWKQKD